MIRGNGLVPDEVLGVPEGELLSLPVFVCVIDTERQRQP